MEMNELNVIKKVVNLRDRRVQEITNLHAGIAGGLAIIPIPFASVPLVLGNLYTMYGRINSVVGVKFSENILKSIGGMIASNLAVYGGAVAACQVIKFIPLFGSIGGALMECALNFATTKVSGALYCELLKVMADNGDIGENGQVNEAAAKRATENVCRDKDRIKKMFEREKQNAKNVDFNKYKSEARKLADEHKK